MRIRHVGLKTECLDDLRRFYGETLAIPLADEREDAFSLRIGASELEFRQGAASSYHFAINIPSNLFDVARVWLAARTPLLPMLDDGDTMHWRAWNAHACYFRDPDDNIGELIARHNLSEEGGLLASSAFDPATHLLGISEIGLALDDVGASCRLIEERLSLPVWDTGDGVRFLRLRSASTRFRALGGERGLLICVRRGHAWFPTSDVLAEPAPLYVTFAGEEERELILPGDGVCVGDRAGRGSVIRAISCDISEEFCDICGVIWDIWREIGRVFSYTKQ